MRKCEEHVADDTLWLDKPASVWEEALPIGNGKLGGMVFGHPHKERIALNEDSVWYGGPRDRNNPDAFANLEPIRRLLLEGKLKEAHDLSLMALSGVPETQRHYMPLGDLFLSFRHEEEEWQLYRRELDLSNGIASIAYHIGDTGYQREIFTSFPDQVMVIRCTSDLSGGINVNARLDRGRSRYYDETVKVDAQTLVMRGNCGGTGGADFRTIIRAEVQGGQLRIIGEHLVVEQADSVTFLLAASTSFRHVDPEAAALSMVEAASQLSFEQLRKRHTDDFCKLANRVYFQLGSTAEQDNQLPTDERLERCKQGGEDLGLIALYFRFGRYLLISSSRPGSLPANLQGIWNEKMLPPWDSKYTININTQMNYWLAEQCHLAECHEPLFDLIGRMVEPGKHTAQTMYRC